MKRPLFLTTIFLCLGIITGMHFYNAYFLVALGILIGCIFFSVFYKSKIPFLFFIAFNVGYVGILQSLTPINNYLQHLVQNNQNFTITGYVHSYNHTRNGRQRIHFRTNHLVYNQSTIYESLTIQAILPYGESVYIGQNLELIGRLNLLTEPSDPYGFNQFRFLRSRGIEYTMFPGQIVQGEIQTSLNTHLQNLRQNIISVFDQTLPQQQASVMQSMIMGDRSGMDLDLLDAFRGSGLYHILVVSGLHMSILMLAMTWLFEKIFPAKISGIISLSVIILYAIMIGGVSVYRASLMAGVLVFSRMLIRSRDFITSISFAALVLLLYQPLFLFDAGFLLSFGSVFGIAFGSQPVERAIVKLIKLLPFAFFTARLLKYNKFIEGVSVTMAVSLMVMPVFAWFFFRIMTYSIFANIVVMITGNLLVVLGFVAGVIGLFSINLARFLSGGLYFLTNGYIWVAQFIYSLPRSLFWTGRPHIVVMIAYYVALFSFYWIFAKRKIKLINGVV